MKRALIVLGLGLPLRALGVEVIRTAVATTGLLRHGVTEEDRAAANQAWKIAQQAIIAGVWDVMILDALHAVLRHELVELSIVLETIADRPAHVEVIATGRRAPKALCAVADLVTEMRMSKHPFQTGIPARQGIAW